MATSVYDLALNISTNIASLETGMAKAADVVGRAGRDMSRQFDELNSRIGFVTGALGSLAAAAGIGFGVKAFADLITGSIAAQAHLQDVADKVGTTASKLSALIPAARLSSTSIDEVGTASAKFSKNLIDVQAGTGKAAEAFKALGFNAKDAARFLADPSQGLLELGQRMNTFATTGTKTAAAMALLGKSGQELLPFLKQLGEQSELTARITDQQAAAAKRLEDQYQTLKLRSDELKGAIASGLVPELSSLLKGFTDATGGPDSLGAKIKALAADGSLGIWLHEAVIGLAVLGESLVAIGKVLYAFSGSVQAVVADIKVLSAALNVKIGSGYEESVENLKTVVAARNATLEDANERWSKAWNDNKTIVSDSLTAQLTNLQAYREAFNKSLAAQAQAVADYNAKIQVGTRTLSFPTSDANDARLRNALAGAKPEVPFSAGSGAAKIDEFAKALETLQKQAGAASAEMAAIFSGEKFTQAQKYLSELQNTKAWSTLTAGQKASVEGLAAYVSDLQRTTNYLREAKAITAEYSKALTDLAKASSAAFARVELANIKVQIDEARRQYDRGVIDFATYWSRLTSAQAAGLQVETTALASNVAEQERIVADLQAAYVTFTESAAQVKLPIEEQLSGAEKAATPLIAAYGKLVEAQTAFTVKQKEATQVGRDYIEVLVAESDGHLKGIKALDNEITRRLEDNAAIGLTTEEVTALTVARIQERLANEQLAGPVAADVLKFYDDQIDRVQKLGVAVSAGENKSRLVAGWQDLFRSAADAGSKFITDFVQHGSSAFKNLWADFKTWALEALAKIAAQKIIVSIAGSLGLGGIATNALAGSNPLGSILGGGAPGGGFGGLNDIFGGLTSSFSSLTDLLTGNFGNLVTSASVTTDALVAGTAGIGSFTSALTGALPVLGLIGLALPLISGLFGKGGGPKEGGTAGEGFYPGETSTANNAKVQGIVDALTVDFQAQMKLLGGKGIAAFALGFDTDPQGTAQNRVSSRATVGGQSVYSALDVSVGRDDAQLQAAMTLEAQRVVLAALKASELPEDIAKLFDSIDVGSATSEQITALEKTAATYAAINAAITDLPDDVQAHFTALLDGTQAMAQNVLVVVGVIKTFGDQIEGLGPKLEALDAEQINAFVDALGGAQAAAQSFAYLGQNFTTSSERMKIAVDALNADFSKLGVTTIPQTHKEFLDLLNSFDVTTEAGRAMYASVLALANSFVTVHGTADAAAGSVNGLADATKRLADATAFFNQNFYSDAERAAKQYAESLKEVEDAQAALGIDIPHSVEGFRALIEGIDQSTAAGQALYAALIVLAPAIFDLSGAAAAASSRVDNLSNSIGNINPSLDARLAVQQTVDTFLSQIAALSEQIAGADIGDRIAFQVRLLGQKMVAIRAAIAHYMDIGDYYNAETLTTELGLFDAANRELVRVLAEFTRLKAQYGDAMAGQLIDLESWYYNQQQALAGNVEALAALATIYAQRWQAIVDGVSTGVDGAISELDRLRKSISGYLKSLQISDVSPLTPMEKLAKARSDFDIDFAKAQGGDLEALSRLTAESDAYLRLARDAYASGQQYTDIFELITTQLGNLVGLDPGGNPVVDDSKVVVDDFQSAVDDFQKAVDSMGGGQKVLSVETVAKQSEVQSDLDQFAKRMVDSISALAAPELLAPALPELRSAVLPELRAPVLPEFPKLPALPEFPPLPEFPTLPEFPALPALPKFEALPAESTVSQQYTGLIDRLSALVNPAPAEPLEPAVDEFKTVVGDFSLAVDRLTQPTPPPVAAAVGGAEVTIQMPDEKSAASVEDLHVFANRMVSAIVDSVSALADANTSDSTAVLTKLDRTTTAIVDAFKSGRK